MRYLAEELRLCCSTWDVRCIRACHWLNVANLWERTLVVAAAWAPSRARQPASVDIFLITLTNVGLWPRTSGGEEGSDADTDRIYICSEDLSKKSGRALNFVAKILKTTWTWTDLFMQFSWNSWSFLFSWSFIQNPKHTSYGIIRFIYSTLFMLLFITPFPWIYLLLKECDFTNFKSMISFRVIWGNIHSKHFSFNYIYFHYYFLDKVYMTDLESL